MINAIEASKSVSVKAVKNKSERNSSQSVVENKLKNAQAETLTQAIEKDTEKKLVKQLQQATDELNQQMEKLNTNIAFAFSDETERLYIRVLEKDTGKLIREFPSEQARALAGYLKNAVGLLFDKES